MMHQPLRPRTSSRPSSRGSSKRTGDSHQRITMPLPRSLRELQGRAVKLFGHGGELKLFHHGRVPIQDPSQLSSIKDGDVVVVTWNDRRLTKGEFAELLQTTNQRDFVKHDLPKPATPTQSAQPNLPPIHSPFEGTTTYGSEYVKHQVTKRESVAKPSHPWVPTEGKTGSSCYADQYPWHDVSRPGPRHHSTDAPKRAPQPLEGCTSYMRDYVKPPPQPKSESAASRPRPKTRSSAGSPPYHTSGEFEGKSSYTAEYTEKPLPTLLADRPKPGAVVTKNPVPFEGLSDYKNNYIEHVANQPIMIHLEPESSRTCSPISSTS